MVRKLALSLAVASVIAAGQANALGLGEIRVNSALNEPLDADIRLVQVRDLSVQQILPRMADVDEFSLAGLTKSRFLSDVKFQVKIAADGSGSIHVTSSVPVQEPFLSFLMEVNWPQGRLVREYTLLLDPPVFDPAPVTTAINAPAATAQSSAPAQPTATKPQASNIQTNIGGGEIFVKNNDTLYVLAKNNRPASDISIEQMMVAMQRKNPELFPTANINVMRAGKVMRLPTAEEARALTRKQAVAEAARQTAEWKAGRRSATTAAQKPASEPAPKPAATEVQAAPSGAADGAPDAAESQLKIVTAEPPASPQEPVSSEAAPATPEPEAETPEPVVETGPSERELELIQRNEDLENRLLVTQESVDKVSRENAELGDKLDSIQEQLAAMQRLIELKDQQMAALQAEMLKQIQEANKPKPSALDEFINMMLANPLYLGGAGGVLLLLLALVALARRRKSDDYDDEPAPRKSKKKKSKSEDAQEDSIPEFDEPPVAPAAVATAAVAGTAAATLAKAEEVDELDDELADLDLDMDLDLDDGADLDESQMSAIDESELADTEIDSVLDDILDESIESDDQEAEDLDALLDSDAEIDTDLDELLEADFDDEPTAEVSADESDKDDLEGLEFGVADTSEDEARSEAADDLIDDEFFSEEVESESELVFESADVEESELIDEPLEMDKPEEPVVEAVSEDGELDDLVDEDLDKMLMDDAAELESEAEHETPDTDLDGQMPELGIEALGVDEEFPPEMESAAGLDQMVSADADEVEDDELLDLGDFETSLSLEDELEEMLAEDEGEIELVEEGDDEDLVEDDLLDALDGADEVETKLDLARAYIEMDDTDGARDILAEITRDGNAEQQAEAQSLLDKLS